MMKHDRIDTPRDERPEEFIAFDEAGTAGRCPTEKKEVV